MSEPEGRGAAWTEERATREGGASEAPRRQAGKHSEPEGRGAAWTEERATKERATREGGASDAPRRRAWKRSPPRVFRGYAFDLDGTVYLGGRLFPGAADTIARIRGRGSRVVFLTTKPLHSPASYAQRLTGLGIPAEPGEMVTPLSVLTAYLAVRHPGKAALTIAEPLVDATLTAAGITVTTEPAAAGV